MPAALTRPVAARPSRRRDQAREVAGCTPGRSCCIVPTDVHLRRPPMSDASAATDLRDDADRWRRQDLALRIAVVLLAILAAWRLGAGYQRLLFAEAAHRSTGFSLAEGEGAVDLFMRRFETRDFFASHNQLRQVYPPASYAMLWPIIGWNSPPAARWTWAVLVTVALGWLSATCARESRASRPLARLAMGLLPLGLIATSAALAVGQVTPISIALLIACTLRCAREPRDRGRLPKRDAATAAMFTVAAIKPTLAAPFGWLLLFAPRSWRPATWAAALYGLLAMSAEAVRNALRSTASHVPGARSAPPTPGDQALLVLRHESIENTRALFHGGYANLQNLAVDLGFASPWSFLPPILAMLAFGAWAWRHRDDDPWILLGVAGLVARLAFYHRVYDDMLAIPALVALARIASGMIEGRTGAQPVEPGTARRALALLLLATLPLLLPVAFVPWSVRSLLCAGTWTGALALLSRAAQDGSSGTATRRVEGVDA